VLPLRTLLRDTVPPAARRPIVGADERGQVHAVVDVDVADGVITTVRIVTNPEKLAGVAAQPRT